MRLAMPYPCSGPIACSVFRTIRASVPCHTSFLSVALSPIVLLGLLALPMGNPYQGCHRSYGKTIEETIAASFCFILFCEFLDLHWNAPLPLLPSPSRYPSSPLLFSNFFLA